MEFGMMCDGGRIAVGAFDPGILNIFTVGPDGTASVSLAPDPDEAEKFALAVLDCVRQARIIAVQYEEVES